MGKERLIVVAGPCGAGKSTLVQGLKAKGYHAHTVAQEHSISPTMWQLTKPEVLIYLDASLEVIKQRRQVAWGEARLQEQRHRLRHARTNCDLYINTDQLTAEEVLNIALKFLEEGQGRDCNTGRY